jgi:hypothetical protein
LAPGEKFDVSKTYEAYVTLEAFDHFTTVGLNASFFPFSLGADPTNDPEDLIAPDNVGFGGIVDYKTFIIVLKNYKITDRQPTTKDVFTIAKPEAGVGLAAAPVHTSYSVGNFEWNPSVTPADTNTVYVASFDIEVVAPGVTLYGVAPDFYTIGTADVVFTEDPDDPKKGKIVAPFDATEKTIPLEFAIVQPVAGETPQTTITAPNNEYTATIKWYEGTTVTPEITKFEAGKVYSARLTAIAPTLGYTLYGLNKDNVTVTPAVDVTAMFNSNVLRIVFPKTDETIKITSASGEQIPVYPTENQAAPADVTDGESYSGVITWTYVDENYDTQVHPAGDPFVLGRIYTAEIALTALPGYTLYGFSASAGVNLVTLNAELTNPASSVVYDNVKGIITIVYMPTMKPPKVVDIAKIAKLGTPPVAGALTSTTSSLNVDGLQVDFSSLTPSPITGLSWIPNELEGDGKFHADKDYRVKNIDVTIVPKPGFTFEGLPADFKFEIEGAADVTHTVVNKDTIKLTGISVHTALPITESNLAITPPSAGEDAVAKFVATDELQEVAIKWYEGASGSISASGPFKTTTVYRAVLSLKPNTGYTLFGLPANFFQVDGATTVTNAAISNTATTVNVTVIFKPTEETITNTDIKVTAPVAGAIAQTTVSDDQWTATVTWSPALPADGKFAVGKEYTAKVTLQAKGGYTLYGLNWYDVKINGNTQNTGPMTAGFCEYKFPATAALIGKEIAIPVGIVPVAGNKPTADKFEASNTTTGTLSWSPAVPATGFVKNTVYTLSGKITPASGYTLYGITSGHFNSVKVKFADGSTQNFTAAKASVSGDVVTITFEVIKEVVSDRNIVITAPKAGETAQTTATTDQWTAAVTWSPALPADGKFAVNTVYTATVKDFVAAEGYTFDKPYDFSTPIDWYTFTVNGNALTDPAPAEKLIGYKFAKTEQLIGKVITIPAAFVPALGAALPATGTALSISGVKVTNITWSPDLKADDVFDRVSYTLSGKIAPNTGYTFYKIAADHFTTVRVNNNGTYETLAVTAAYNVSDSIVTVTFAVLPKTIDITAIPDVLVPEIGASRIVYAETDQWTATVTWKSTINGVTESFSGAKFESGGVIYTASVKVTPKEGYTVYGLQKDVFTLVADPAIAAKNSAVTSATAASVTVTIAFPPTWLTGLNTPQASSLKVASINGALVVSGLTPGEQVSIYIAQGVLVSRKAAVSDRQETRLPSGIYIVVSGDRKVKTLNK